MLGFLQTEISMESRDVYGNVCLLKQPSAGTKAWCKEQRHLEQVAGGARIFPMGAMS